jgi:outer membrane translocation and assembly module TamA
LYRIDYTRYSEQDLEGFDFNRIDIELDQFIPIARANWVIALRALASTTDVNDGDVVPFFLLPSLGGGSELRGYPNFRFTDRHRMLLTAEYRWTPSKFMDMAIFYEVGKVASRREDLDFEDLHDSYGIGVRFHAPRLTALRFDLAHSDEATIRFIISGGASF